jgi:hypothetical protein
VVPTHHLEIEAIRAELDEARSELAALRAAREPVAFVEVTHSDGLVSVMPVAEYQRLSALDLRHTRLRMLTRAEARIRGLAAEG